MSDVVQSVRQLLQDFIAPELRELKSDVRQLDGKIDSESSGLKAKIDFETNSLRRKSIPKPAKSERILSAWKTRSFPRLAASRTKWIRDSRRCGPSSKTPTCAPNWKPHTTFPTCASASRGWKLSAALLVNNRFLPAVPLCYTFASDSLPALSSCAPSHSLLSSYS